MKKQVVVSIAMATLVFGGSFSPADLSLGARNGAMARLGIASGGTGGNGVEAFCIHPAVLGSGGRSELSAGILPIDGGAVLGHLQLALASSNWGFGVQAAYLQSDPYGITSSMGDLQQRDWVDVEGVVTAAIGFSLVRTSQVRWAFGLAGNLFPGLQGRPMDWSAGASTVIAWNVGIHQVRLGMGLLRFVGEERVGERSKIAVAGTEASISLGKNTRWIIGIEGALEHAEPSLNLSTEVALAGVLFLRGGVKPVPGPWDLGVANFGGGIRLGRLAMDYAMLPSRNWGSVMHQFTVRLDVGK